jgi:hypothetical protein
MTNLDTITQGFNTINAFMVFFEPSIGATSKMDLPK